MCKNTFIMPALVLALGIGCTGFFIGQGIKQKTVDRSVMVKGLAERIVKSDQAIWEMTCNYTSDNLVELYQGIARIQNQVKNFWLAQGFLPENIQLNPVAVTDNASVTYNSNEKAKRYQSDIGMVLTSSQIDSVANAIQKTNQLIEAGVVLKESNVRYLFTQLNQIKPAMLSEAMDNAESAATLFAKKAGNSLGMMRSANQGLFEIQSATGKYSENEVNKKVRVIVSVAYGIK